MPNWLKVSGKWGALILGSLFFVGLGLVAFFPEASNELAYTADNKWGSVFVILALVITLLKQIIGFIGFLTTIIKIGIILAFVGVFLGVGFMILRTWKASQSNKE